MNEGGRAGGTEENDTTSTLTVGKKTDKTYETYEMYDFFSFWGGVVSLVSRILPRMFFPTVSVEVV